MSIEKLQGCFTFFLKGNLILMKQEAMKVMNQEKQTYYVNITDKTILTEPVDTPSFVIYATEKEIKVLHAVFEESLEADFATYLRAHIPNLEYHPVPENDQYDEVQKVIYSIIYHLGDAEAKRHIEQMGILTDKKSDDPEQIRQFR